jgi:hypothetical protein
MEWAIALIDEERGDDFEAVGNVHDALVGYINEDRIETVLLQVTHIMSNLPLHKLGWNPPLQFIVVAETGLNMAALKKWKPALKLAAQAFVKTTVEQLIVATGSNRHENECNFRLCISPYFYFRVSCG